MHNGSVVALMMLTFRNTSRMLYITGKEAGSEMESSLGATRTIGPRQVSLAKLEMVFSHYLKSLFTMFFV